LHSRIPIIFITADDQEDDVVAALTAGADEFLSKPLRRLELLARLESLRRRAIAGPFAVEVFEVGEFRLDVRSRSITRDNEPLALTSKDFDLASLLLRNVGRLLSRSYLLETIWRARTVRLSRSLDTHISRVRYKLQLTPEHGWRLVAVYGYGYRLDQAVLPSLESDREPDAS
jgi:two-component system, OmpR family, response regulator RegX3